MKIKAVSTTLFIQAFVLSATMQAAARVHLSAESQAKVRTALYRSIENVSCNGTTLRLCLRSFENAFSYPSNSYNLTCAELNPGHGADLRWTCIYSIGLGKYPSMRIAFSAKIDAAESEVRINEQEIVYVIDPVAN